ncbi:aminoglycoside phosphotransferase family protein [Nocardia salmonicida]|uniref:aminoglycoside phosphotransferase family protein n=1 Tax=Nocardia salmonicida TaxID=53431 RepID=UPI0007A3B785|nr:aminoglycoside phosphotransferase family protein [Nocardia salmonicida]
MNVPTIPERLEAAIIFLRGEQDGRAWLGALPDRLGYYAERWGLELESIAENGAMSCCAYCVEVETGRAAVLKIPVDLEAGNTEMRMIDRWAAGNAAPSVLQHDIDTGVFLMTRVIPGTVVWPGSDPGESASFATLLSRLNAPDLPEPPVLKDLADVVQMRIAWARERFDDPRFVEDVERVAIDRHLEEAQRVLERLLITTERRHVLHADLQAKNILQGPDLWYTIDPLGAVGDVNAEAALWVAVQDGPRTIVERLGDLASHPLLTPSRLYAWSYVFAVAEYRPYLPASGARIEQFLSGVDHFVGDNL